MVATQLNSGEQLKWDPLSSAILPLLPQSSTFKNDKSETWLPWLVGHMAIDAGVISLSPRQAKSLCEKTKQKTKLLMNDQSIRL